ncbi:hypothetical protein EVAR_98468_1 [Eumeta japonica]|uniref:Uncharacterized protein n=1 Tax=Eumeta variegata TaxID=151549 RepID=A0A4C1YSF9_EUMVA|nr:hypothetical protein EVAR_98468_1 [Eumeta japonica]
MCQSSLWSVNTRSLLTRKSPEGAPLSSASLMSERRVHSPGRRALAVGLPLALYGVKIVLIAHDNLKQNRGVGLLAETLREATRGHA